MPAELSFPLQGSPLRAGAGLSGVRWGLTATQGWLRLTQEDELMTR